MRAEQFRMHNVVKFLKQCKYEVIHKVVLFYWLPCCYGGLRKWLSHCN